MDFYCPIVKFALVLLMMATAVKSADSDKEEEQGEEEKDHWPDTIFNWLKLSAAEGTDVGDASANLDDQYNSNVMPPARLQAILDKLNEETPAEREKIAPYLIQFLFDCQQGMPLVQDNGVYMTKEAKQKKKTEQLEKKKKRKMERGSGSRGPHGSK